MLSVDSESDKPPSSSDPMMGHTELYAVLDTGQTKRPQTPLPVSGPELAARLKIGTRVVRGVDWKWGDQVQTISHPDWLGLELDGCADHYVPLIGWI